MTLKETIQNIEDYNDVTLITPDEWLNNNKAGFPKWMTKTFMKYTDKTMDSSDVLFPHQRLIRDYLQAGSPYRGLLLYHGLGVGKTRTSVGVSEILLNSQEKKKALVILPASLRQNFINELKSFGNILYNKNNKWQFFEIDKDTKDDLLKLFDSTVLQYLNTKNKGVWLPILKSGGIKISDEKDPDKQAIMEQQISLQIDVFLESRYEFVHYNGLTEGKINALLKSNDTKKDAEMFDDKIIIIDEVHNLTSGLNNSKTTLKYKLYSKLFKSNNSTFILLSGTPIINDPVEIAYTINLLRGEQITYSVELSGMPFELDIRSKLKYIDMFSMKALKKNILFSCTLIPPNFKMVNGHLVQRTTLSKSTEYILAFIEAGLAKLKDIKGNAISVQGRFKATTNYALPIDSETFYKNFVDEDKMETKANGVFQRRIMGSVSYYENYDKKLYPTQLDPVVVSAIMSENQFKKYTDIRNTEIKKEQNAKKMSRNGANAVTSSGTYKIFSRAVCNFAFPDDIKRPFPKSAKQFLKEMDSTVSDDISSSFNLENDDDLKMAAMNTYKNDVFKALQKLDENKKKYLKIDAGLEQQSPKYNALIKNIGSIDGTSIVYSDYRMVEGLKTLGISFEANDWSEIKVVMDDNKQIDVSFDPTAKYFFAKYSDPDTSAYMKQANEIVLNIFNNRMSEVPKTIRDKLNEKAAVNSEGNLRGYYLKVLMITRSGAEGISLRNVRGVHILEPYWNNIRIDQVIGRANRTNSHIELPEKDRNFRVYYYMAKFSEKHKIDIGLAIKRNDKDKTSDEVIKNIANKKSAVISGFLMNLKNASVDCAIHKASHVGLKCLEFKGDVSDFDNAFTFNISDEYIEMDDSVNMKTNLKTYVVQFKTIESIKNKKYIYVVKKDAIYDHDVYTKTGVLDRVGTMTKLNDNQYEVSIVSKKQSIPKR